MHGLTQNDRDFYAAGGWGYRLADRPASEYRLTGWLTEYGITSGAKTLDAGCGDGWWTSMLHDRGFDVTGLDRNPGAIETAEATWPGPTYVVGELDDLDETFDFIFARGLFATADVFAMLRDVLNPNGRVLYIRSTDGTGVVKPGIIGTPAQNPTLEEMADAIKASGLEIYRSGFDRRNNEAVYGARRA